MCRSTPRHRRVSSCLSVMAIAEYSRYPASTTTDNMDSIFFTPLFEYLSYGFNIILQITCTQGYQHLNIILDGLDKFRNLVA